MWLTEVGAPVAATDGDDRELGDDNGGADGGGDFFGGLDAETDVALGVTDDDDAVCTISLSPHQTCVDDTYALKRVR